jgi:hypothetical protein
MPATHTLTVTTADGTEERKVNGGERLILKAGPDLRSYKVKDLSSVVVDDPGEGSVRLFIGAPGVGFSRAHGAVRLEVGSEKWQLSELLHFELKPIPAVKPPEPEPLPNVWELIDEGGNVVGETPALTSAELAGQSFLDDDDPRRWEIGGLAPRGRTWRLDDERIVSVRRKGFSVEEPAEEPVAEEVGAV